MAGLSPAFGRGAMTNSWTDLENTKCFLFGGSNAAENHPIAMKYALRAQAKGAKIIVVDPRFTRTASKADLFAQLRPGTDIAYLGAIINYILEKKLYNVDYVTRFTNAACKVNSNYKFNEGLFSGFDEAKGTYNTDTWTYELDANGQPVKAASLEEPGTVFSLLKEHYKRYTLEVGSSISGIAPETIAQIADTMVENQPATVMYALGMTHHTTASQGIRCYSIIQLLLGNIGKAGGGINALRGEPNVQGSTDFSNLGPTLPGYIPAPSDVDTTTTIYGQKYGAAARKHLISLLKAWYGSIATEDNDYCYNYLPRMQSGKAITYIPMMEDMARGQFKLLFNIGINPMVSIPNNQVVATGLAKLETMVFMDIFESETSAFWRAPGVNPETINTEVFFLPVAYLYEKAGSMTGSGRWVQWKPAAVKPEGSCLPDLDILDIIYHKVQKLYAGSADSKDRAILDCQWDYGHEPDPEKVLMEINGYNTKTGKLINTIGEYLAAPPGDVSSGCWVYAGVFNNGVNLSKRRDNKDPSGLSIFPTWSYSWPANIRVLYNRASCDGAGQPVDSARKLIWWDEAKKQWTGPDVPDVPNRANGPDTPDGQTAFRMTAERMGRLFALRYANKPAGANMPFAVSAMCNDGPVPEFYEPIESPTGNLLHPKVATNPVARIRQVLKDKQNIGKAEDYPIVLTTYGGGTMHFCSGSVTRNLPWLVELRPENFVEIGTGLAKKLDIKTGEMVEVSSARGSMKIKAMVTDRIQPLSINGKETHTVGIAFGWGFVGLATGESVNCLTHAAIDPPAGTPEYKAQLVNIRKVK